jgi:hypothetical protein
MTVQTDRLQQKQPVSARRLWDGRRSQAALFRNLGLSEIGPAERRHSLEDKLIMEQITDMNLPRYLHETRKKNMIQVAGMKRITSLEYRARRQENYVMGDMTLRSHAKAVCIKLRLQCWNTLFCVHVIKTNTARLKHSTNSEFQRRVKMKADLSSQNRVHCCI